MAPARPRPRAGVAVRGPPLPRLRGQPRWSQSLRRALSACRSYPSCWTSASAQCWLPAAMAEPSHLRALGC
eukprot:47828-Alexandrium_andersonii.AAC.1